MITVESTAELVIPSARIDQVIGQARAVEIVRLAARQRRFLLLIGEPGTGKSLLGRAVAELLEPIHPLCIASFANDQDPSCPHILLKEREDILAMGRQMEKDQQRSNFSHHYLLAFAALALLGLCCWLALKEQTPVYILVAIFGLTWLWKQRLTPTRDPSHQVPKILPSSRDGRAPFIDATACSEGALFGDVRHDPYQSGGVESPPHQLVEAGAVHRAHGGVLYIDEIGSLSATSQKLLLTAIQDKALPITGRQSGSSGTLIRTAPVPCDFVLVAAGNAEDLDQLSPALRSRILGYGYEVLTQSSMPDTAAHQKDLAMFIAQEVEQDGRIPHFDRSAIEAIVEQARLRAEVKGRLTTRLRDLGGLVRVAGDLAVRAGDALVAEHHVLEALDYASSIEEQRSASAPSPRLPSLMTSKGESLPRHEVLFKEFRPPTFTGSN